MTKVYKQLEETLKELWQIVQENKDLFETLNGKEENYEAKEA